MKSIQLFGIGNSLLDMFVNTTDKELQQLGIEKSSALLISSDEQKELLAKLSNQVTSIASGGSVANTIMTFADLGGRAGYFGQVGHDEHGNFFKSEFTEKGIHFPVEGKYEDVTGTALMLITPDSERTIRTSLGVTSELHLNEQHEDHIKKSEWVLIEGYVIANGEKGKASVLNTLEYAKAHNTKVALTLSAGFIIEYFFDILKSIHKDLNLVIGNEEEMKLFAGKLHGGKTLTLEETIEVLKDSLQHAVVTLGDQGSKVIVNGETFHSNAFQASKIDLTGAGDTFAAAYLYGLTHDLTPGEALKKANFLASKVIEHYGARLKSNVKSYWEEA
jgi:sugar/nucleoside kinase (ribokinase family)